LATVGSQTSDDESGEEKQDKGNDDADDDWVFDTIKPVKAPVPVKQEPPAPLVNKNLAVQQDDSRLRSSSEPPKRDPTSPPVKTAKEGAPLAKVPSNGNVGGSPTGAAVSPAGAAGAAAPGARPSALTSVIYPVLSKLLKSNQEEEVIASLAQLKLAFDKAEKAKPGITHTMIAHIIELLKR